MRRRIENKNPQNTIGTLRRVATRSEKSRGEIVCATNRTWNELAVERFETDRKQNSFSIPVDGVSLRYQRIAVELRRTLYTSLHRARIYLDVQKTNCISNRTVRRK